MASPLAMHICIIYNANMHNEPESTNLNEQIQRLNFAIESGNLTQSIISIATGVHQSQVSRILSGGAKTISKNVIKLCKYSDSLHNKNFNNRIIDPLIGKAIAQVWDGSTEHAEAIAKVIFSLKGMTIKQHHAEGARDVKL